MGASEPTDGIFDFVVDDDFRACLEEDYLELETAIDSGCWKAAHVLAGSIVEAILVDYLLASGHRASGKEDPHRMELAALVEKCKEEQVLSDKIAGLTHVVRGFRNLIHPGRLIRQKETVDENGAQVAARLVGMLASEIAVKRQATYGYTAKQIVSKVERDPSAVSILEHLLKEVKAQERERLLLVVIPERVADINSELWDDVEIDTRSVDALCAAFRIAMQLADNTLREKVMQRYVTILKEESGEVVCEYEDNFVRSEDFVSLDYEAQLLVAKHLIARLKSESSTKLFDVVYGMAEYIVDEQTLTDFIDELVRAKLIKGVQEISNKANAVLTQAYNRTSSRQDTIISARFADWIEMLEDKERIEDANALRDIKNIYDLNVDFDED